MSDIFLKKSLLRKKKKNIIHIILLSILTLVMIGGTLLILVLQNGLKGMEKRLGADIMVVPADCERTAENILLEGSREYFYFDGNISSDISAISGVEELTVQFYLSSLPADCCSSQVGIVGFDPETDFIIQPWIDEKDRGKISTGVAVVGSDIQIGETKEIELFGRTYPVVSTLASTGTSMDTSVYFTMDTVPQLIEDATNKGIQFLDTQKNENVISSVFINISDGVAERDMARMINAATVADVDILYPDSILKSFSQNTRRMITSTYIVLFAVWLLVEILLIIVCYISSNAQKKEYALLRILGVSGKSLARKILKENFLISLAGVIVGGFLSFITVFPFGRYLAYGMGIAYLTPGILEIIIVLGVGFIFATLSNMLASIIPISRICKLDLYSVLREEE